MSSKLSARRRFLRDSAALVGLSAGVIPAAAAQMSHTEAPAKEAASKEAASKDAVSKDAGCKDANDVIAYGERSRYVKSIRVPVSERMSPDMFGMTFHVASPLQDSVGMITASSLHYVSTHRGSYLPDINPAEHRLMIHGMVDRPLIFTVDEIKRFPFVTRASFPGVQRKSRQTHG